jgi:hypothetical protein
MDFARRQCASLAPPAADQNEVDPCERSFRGYAQAERISSVRSACAVTATWEDDPSE